MQILIETQFSILFLSKWKVAENIQEIFKRKLVPVGFDRTMGLLGATTLGVGALMGAGIYVLIGLAAGYAGPAVWLSYLICGLLSLLSVLVFGELSRNVRVVGGGYAFVYKALLKWQARMSLWTFWWIVPLSLTSSSWEPSGSD